ncbi:MAG: hypothetical protein K6C05_05235 [Anaerovibrio sp.]|uniref:hypothetical protein n=1 Tax=Anaerovibrio sp. TaxID=1872532 RepID=UPI0025F04C81|nr:hypothetical protein [Anaerovibrio sp.]MCR5176235.1 hypothetical protein [Anaerovibrio sp.]
MYILRICLVILLIFWLLTEFGPEEISSITGGIGICFAIMVLILYNKKHHEQHQNDEEYCGEDDSYDMENKK